MSGTDIILVAHCPVGKQEGYATCCTADTCKAHLEIALRALGVPDSRITTQARPCRQQVQQHQQGNMTLTVPKALRRLQDTKEVGLLM